MLKLVYLDQNAWIDLFRERQGKGLDEDMRKSLQTVMRTSDSGDAIFPISVIHFIETSSIGDVEKREKFLDFMFEICKGYAIIPFVTIFDAEIRQAVRKRAGLLTVNLKRFVIGKGLPFMLGATLEIVKKGEGSPDIPEDLKQEILEHAESAEMLLQMMKEKDVVKQLRENRNMEIRVMQDLEKIRKEDEKIIDRDLRYRVSMTKYLRTTIVPKMVAVIVSLGLQPQLVIPEDATRKDIESLFQSMPTAYTTWVLTHRRDVQSHRKIDKNDWNDIAALSIAIPYCDIVVSEKMWTSIALQAKLDRLYDTVILASVKDLQKHLA